jgi:hypothetical protein
MVGLIRYDKRQKILQRDIIMARGTCWVGYEQKGMKKERRSYGS